MCQRDNAQTPKCGRATVRYLLRLPTSLLLATS